MTYAVEWFPASGGDAHRDDNRGRGFDLTFARRYLRASIKRAEAVTGRPFHGRRINLPNTATHAATNRTWEAK